jgi:hypothetical protein
MERRALVMDTNPGRWNYSAPDRQYLIANGVEAWVGALRGDFIGRTLPSAREIRDYDLIIANLNPALIDGYRRLADRRPPGQTWVGLVEGCGRDYLDPPSSLLRFMEQCDLIANINEHTTAYLQSLTTTPVRWVGIPYPIEAVRALGTRPEDQRREALVCPRQYRQPSFVVAEALGVPVRAFFQKTSRTFRNIPTYVRHGYFKTDLRARAWLNERGPTPRIADIERSMHTFWSVGGGCAVWVNLDPRYTWARFVLDGAALGVPVISTDSTAHSGVLFPELTVRDVFCVDEAISIGRRLLADEEYRRSVIATAQRGLERYSVEASVKRLDDALLLGRA